MKKRNIILGFTLLVCLGCGNGESSEAQQENKLAEQEEIMAKEAEEISAQPKEEAISTEKEIDELLNDI